jgi:hypothetical protein
VEDHFEAFVIDKNSLWGGLNIQKRQLCVKGILAQDLGFVLGPFQRGFGGFRGRGGEGAAWSKARGRLF